eukprot:s1406_g2.t1
MRPGQRLWLHPRWLGASLVALVLAAGGSIARCWASIAPSPAGRALLGFGTGTQGRAAGAKTPQAALFITEEPFWLRLYEELQRAPPIKKKRRKRVYLREDGEWKLISKDQPLPTPSEEPSKLLLQIDESGKALRLLEFLENAVHSPAFEMKHAVRALDTLVVQRPSLNEEDLARLGDQPGLAALVERTKAFLQQIEDEDGGLGPRWSTLLLHALAVYQDIQQSDDIPVLHRLVVPVAEEAAQAVPDMNNKQLARCVWAIGELRHVSRLLQDGRFCPGTTGLHGPRIFGTMPLTASTLVEPLLMITLKA